MINLNAEAEKRKAAVDGPCVERFASTPRSLLDLLSFGLLHPLPGTLNSASSTPRSQQQHRRSERLRETSRSGEPLPSRVEGAARRLDVAWTDLTRWVEFWSQMAGGRCRGGESSVASERGGPLSVPALPLFLLRFAQLTPFAGRILVFSFSLLSSSFYLVYDLRKNVLLPFCGQGRRVSDSPLSYIIERACPTTHEHHRTEGVLSAWVRMCRLEVIAKEIREGRKGGEGELQLDWSSSISQHPSPHPTSLLNLSSPGSAVHRSLPHFR